MAIISQVLFYLAVPPLILGGVFFVASARAQQPASSLSTDAGSLAARNSTETRDSNWPPPDIDDSVPPVEPDSVCDIKDVLPKAGQRIQEFVENVQRFTATESVMHESITKSGKISGQEQRKYDYLVSIEEIRPRVLDVEEFVTHGSASVDFPGGLATKGLPALVLIFHPFYSDDFSMRCEGIANLRGTRAWQIYFRQREDKPSRVRTYTMGWNGVSYHIALKGRAWFFADSYQIAGLQTDLIQAIPEIRLSVDHTAIEYGPVHFTSRGIDMWLPQTAEMYSDVKGKRIHQQKSFSNYLLFAVEEKQRIGSPKTEP